MVIGGGYLQARFMDLQPEKLSVRNAANALIWSGKKLQSGDRGDFSPLFFLWSAPAGTGRSHRHPESKIGFRNF
jgi:hypothetical protein